MKPKNKLVVALMSASVLILSAMSVSSAPHATVPGTYLEDFARTTLLAPAAGVTLSDGATLIYWNAFGKGTFSIQDSVLVAVCDSFAYYRFATSTSKRFAYCIFRIKGDARAKNNRIYTRLAAQGPSDSGGISDIGGISERLLDTLVGPDSLPVPAITTQFQTIVVDMKKNGLSFGLGADACQIGTHAPMELDIDYIFMSNTNPLDTSSAVKISKSGSGLSNVGEANVWVSGPSNTIMIKTNGANVNGALSLYDLQGKTVQSSAVRSQGSLCKVPLTGSLRGNVYLYTLSGATGAILGKGKISLR